MKIKEKMKEMRSKSEEELKSHLKELKLILMKQSAYKKSSKGGFTKMLSPS
jgi:ribosomal protein L29